MAVTLHGPVPALAAGGIGTAELGAGVVTGPKLGSAIAKAISFDGKNGTGAITATGAAVGERVLYVFGITGGALGNASGSFEAAITVADQIQQSSASNLSANDYVAILLPAAA